MRKVKPYFLPFRLATDRSKLIIIIGRFINKAFNTFNSYFSFWPVTLLSNIKQIKIITYLTLHTNKNHILNDLQLILTTKCRTIPR